LPHNFEARESHVFESNKNEDWVLDTCIDENEKNAIKSKRFLAADEWTSPERKPPVLQRCYNFKKNIPPNAAYIFPHISGRRLSVQTQIENRGTFRMTTPNRNPQGRWYLANKKKRLEDNN
jgi:hypothetical protein